MFKGIIIMKFKSNSFKVRIRNAIQRRKNFYYYRLQSIIEKNVKIADILKIELQSDSHIGENVIIRNRNRLIVGHKSGIRDHTIIWIGKTGQIIIGNNVSIGYRGYCLSTAPVIIEDGVRIGPDVKILAESKGYDNIDIPINDQDFKESKGIFIGKDSWIGAGAIILDNLKIGEGVVVGAGSVVTKDIPPFSVVAGNPARILKNRKADTH